MSISLNVFMKKNKLIKTVFLLCLAVYLIPFNSLASDTKKNEKTDVIETKSAEIESTKELSKSAPVSQNLPIPSEEPEAARGQDTSLAEVWGSRIEDLKALTSETVTLRIKAGIQAEQLLENTRKYRVQFTRLNGLYQASRGHPMEQLTIVHQMSALESALKKELQPFDSIIENLKQKKKDIAYMQEDLNEFTLYLEDLEDEKVADTSGLTVYRDKLYETSKLIDRNLIQLEGLSAPAASSLLRIGLAVKNIDTNLTEIWEKYYLSKTDMNKDSVLSSYQLVEDWFESIVSRLDFAYPQSIHEWINALKSFLIINILMVAVGFFAFKYSYLLPPVWRRATKNCINKSGAWLATGFAILVAASNQYDGMYSSFNMIGIILFLLGLERMSWQFRLATTPEIKNISSPARVAIYPVIIALILLFLDMPPRLLSYAIFVIVSIFIYYNIRLVKKYKDVKMPSLEFFIFNSSTYINIVVVFALIFGYPRLAVLLQVFYISLCVGLMLAFSLWRMFLATIDLIFNKDKKPVRNAIAEALSVPLALACAVFLLAPIAWAMPGAFHLLGKLTMQSISFGEATFDLTKIVGVVVIYFIFHSLISFIKAAFEQMPARLPHVEKGVFPPLQHMLVYGMWILFAFVALGMIGFNFANIAFVAGGLSVGIGFGMKNIFDNLISGIIIIFDRSILVGDILEIGTTRGTVKDISIRSITIETAERALVIVPNSTIMTGQFINWTRNGRLIRSSLVIGVAYGSDIELVKSLLLQVAKEHEHVLVFPEPFVLFDNFGASSLDFTLHVFIDDFNNSVLALSELRMRIQALFEEHDIDIPFPQMTLHVPNENNVQTNFDVKKNQNQEGSNI